MFDLCLTHQYVMPKMFGCKHAIHKLAVSNFPTSLAALGTKAIDITPDSKEACVPSLFLPYRTSIP